MAITKHTKWILSICAVLTLVLLILYMRASYHSEYKIIIGRDTTYLIDPPMRDDGTVDYVAHLNRKLCVGVTYENNAMVLLIMAIGPDALSDEELREEELSRLGIRDLPEKGDYFITLQDFLDEKGMDSARQDQLFEQFCEARYAPWSADEFPVLSEWIKINQGPLSMVIEASKRDLCYFPLVGDSILSSPLYPAGTIRVMSDALAIRAMSKIKTGDYDGAWEDLAALSAIGHLMTKRNVSSFGYMFGLTLDNISKSGFVALAKSGLSERQATDYLERIRSMDKVPEIFDAIEGDRLMALDSVMMILRDRDFKDALGHEVENPKVVDFNIILKMINGNYDRIMDICKITSRWKRREEHSLLWEELENPTGPSWFELACAPFSAEIQKRIASEAIGNLLASLLIPGLESEVDERIYNNLMSHLAELALSLTRHKASNGEYPDSLDELVPRFFKPGDIQDDPFSEKPLIYRKSKSGYTLYSVGHNSRDDGGQNNLDSDVDEIDNVLDDIVIKVEE